MNNNLYSVTCTVDNGWTKERWEVFVFAKSRILAKQFAIKFFEEQSMETVVCNVTCQKIDYDNRTIICTRRVEH